MTRFLASRLAQATIVLLAVSLIVFVLLSQTGDPVLQMLGPHSTQEQRDELRERLGLDRPIHVQYGRYLVSAVQGDLGNSLHINKPALGLILDRMPATLELAFAAMLFAGGLAFPLGILAALRPRGALARTILTGSLLGISMPTFVTGILFMWIFAVIPNLHDVGWLPRMPALGRGQTTMVFGYRTGLLTLDGLLHIVLPAMTLGLYYLAVLTRLIRTEMIEELSQDFVRTARSKGLGEALVVVKHALRNALIPVVTVMGLQLGGLIAFSIVTETIYQWPGMGKFLIESIGKGDRPVVLAYLLLVAVIFVTLNLAVDILYAVIDPRVRVSA